MPKKTSRIVLARRLDALQDVAVELMTARKLDTVLSMIVNKAVDLVMCDGGSLYLAQNEEFLVFEIAVNRSIDFSFERTLIPVKSRGLATYAFRNSKPVRLKDAYDLKPDAELHFDPSFDLQTGYRTRSVLIQPLMSSKGERLGVLQLVNRKRRPNELWPSHDNVAINKMPVFSQEDERLLQSFAGIASAAIENAQLYKNIEGVFEGFVTASISAIETRDHTTSGHSERVALLTVELAKTVSASEDTATKHIAFSEAQINELRYAALLHDFGKISVREEVLQKEEKLSPAQKLRIRARLEDFKHSYEIKTLRALIQEASMSGKAPTELDIARINKAVTAMNETFDAYWSDIITLNSPAVMEKDIPPVLNKLQETHCENCHGETHPLLLPDEAFCLSIRRGSLTPDERREVESHVTHTYNFLRKIPWTSEFLNIPDIAHAHHEYLDGTGYPRRIKDPQIPVQSKIMTVCDIFDALVASDRPYKPALSFQAALDILQLMARDKKLDKSLLDIFIAARVFDLPAFTQLIQPRRKSA
jgi:HD-GYP domain-containing protein (c-di-GMP phosphodiesterase class II)